MLRNTFLYVKGVGEITERRLWSAGILSWDDLIRSNYRPPRARRMDLLKQEVEKAEKHLEENDLEYFTQGLPIDQRWRIFPHFRHMFAYLDIEATGLDPEWDEITTIALYDGKEVKTYVYGINLDDFPRDLMKYKVLVTYNGSCFDLPFIRRFFGTSLPQVHIDLRYLLHSIGVKGGLKECEKRLGIERGEMSEFDGISAAIAWRKFEENRDQKLLETLLRYNCLDTVVLEHLMVVGYNTRVDATPFGIINHLTVPEIPDVPFVPDSEWLKRIESEATKARAFVYGQKEDPVFDARSPINSLYKALSFI